MARQDQTRSARRPTRRPAEPSPQASPEDALAEAELEVLGDAPAFALAESYLANARALGLAAQNAVAEQQQTAIAALGATLSGVAKLLSLDPPPAADAPIPSPADATPSQKEP